MRAATLLLILFTGCSTVHHFALVDIDLRTPEQIAAEHRTASNRVAAAPGPWWQFALDIISVFKGRFRLLAIDVGEPSTVPQTVFGGMTDADGAVSVPPLVPLDTWERETLIPTTPVGEE